MLVFLNDLLQDNSLSFAQLLAEVRAEFPGTLRESHAALKDCLKDSRFLQEKDEFGIIWKVR